MNNYRVGDLIEKWAPTGLLDGDVENKKELAALLEETQHAITNAAKKQMGSNDTISNLALPLVRRVYVGKGEHWFDVQAFLSELYVREKVIKLFLKEPSLAEHEAMYVQDNSPHFPPKMTEGLVRRRTSVSNLDLKAELRNIISEYVTSLHQ
jgi:hypothetical protein